jgi:hypothetical protein
MIRLSIAGLLTAGLLLAAGCGTRGAASGDSTGPKTLSGTVSGAGDVTSSKMDLADANEAFRKALGYYTKGRPGQPDSNRNLTLARKKFGEAKKDYERAFELDPENKPLESRILDCNRYMYACMKMSTL